MLIISCKKDEVKVTTSSLEITLKKNEAYTLDLGSLCDECGLLINKQAKYFLTSEIRLDTTSQRLYFIYLYKPAVDYTGTDEVEIKSSSGSDGSSPNNNIHLKTIRFTVTN
ncbi:MAG: hypothetical protein K2Q24_00615 [Chitinophagaceae bacterium]|jgi:hypothetical protein|nr:hypothetical protein [Chitinophagaceae bacterium]